MFSTRARHAGLLIGLLVAAALLLASCGSDSDDSAAGTTGVTETNGTTTTSSATPEGGTRPTDEVCNANQSPNGLDYTVSGIPADDPDGGLVVSADAGTSNSRLDVLPAGTEVITTNDPARCAVVSDGGVWWQVAYGDGQDGWVNSRFLTQSAAQEAANTAEVCDLYRQVLDFEVAPDFAPRALTSSLDAALSGPPGGVSDALARISSPADGEDLFLAYESVKGYVGPICGG